MSVGQRHGLETRATHQVHIPTDELIRITHNPQPKDTLDAEPNDLA